MEHGSPGAAITVIQAIAAAEGKEPLELGYALEEYVPVDAIEALAKKGILNGPFDSRCPTER